MKKKLLWMVAWICVGSVAVAGTASARVIDKNRFKGTTAAVTCSQVAAIVCDDGLEGSIQTDIFLSGEEFVTRSDNFPDDAGNNLFATVRTFNSCTQEFSGSFGSLPNSSTQSLQSAHLQGVVPLQDFETEAPAGSLAVDVNMSGIGSIVHDRSRVRFDFEGPEGTTVAIMINLKGKTRSATASGTLSLDGSPLTCAFSDGTLMDVNNGDKTLEHP
jgi:hypothetical protein